MKHKGHGSKAGKVEVPMQHIHATNENKSRMVALNSLAPKTQPSYQQTVDGQHTMRSLLQLNCQVSDMSYSANKQVRFTNAEDASIQN